MVIVLSIKNPEALKKLFIDNKTYFLCELLKSPLPYYSSNVEFVITQ